MNTRTLLWIVLAPLFFTSCGEKEAQEPTSLADRQRLLEQYRQQAADLQSKIQKLEQEITADDSYDPKANLRRVEMMTLNPTLFEHFIEIQGDVKSDKNLTVTPELPGLVVKRYVEEGQAVSKGQILAELDAEIARKNIEEMETRLSLAETVFQRQQNLWNQKIGSEVQYLQAKNNKEAIEKSIESAKSQLGKAFVRAPIDGIVDQFFINTGEMASPGMPLARVVNLSQVEITAEISEAYTLSVRKGDSVTVRFPAIAQEKRLPIAVVGQFINPQNRTFRIEMQARNTDGMLKPNTMAVVQIRDFAQDKAVVVPSYLIQQATDGSRFIYAVRPEGSLHKVEKRAITIGKSYKGFTMIEEGLAPSEFVVTKGYNEVIDGEEVNVVGQTAATTASNPIR